jgi:hypothetical protein
LSAIDESLLEKLEIILKTSKKIGSLIWIQKKNWKLKSV